MAQAHPSVGIVGASGYSGAVAARILAAHPGVRLAFCTSDKLAGRDVGAELAVRGTNGLAYVANASAEALALECDAVLLATAADVSARLVPKLVAAKKVVIDLSGAFRLAAAADYERWYGFTHPAPELLASAHYGLPELFGAPPPGTKLVANPGCYPTAALLALAPLVKAGLVEAAGIIVDAKSGVTGAGRQAKEEFSFGEVSDDLRAYKVLAHQHTPEITRSLSRFAPAQLTFTAHLLPLRRGLMATCYARPKSGTTEAHVRACLAEAYAKTAFVHAVAPGDVTLKSVAGTNHARVGGAANGDVVIAIGAIDNLVKGAAGQAVQNLNALLGFEDGLGLDALARFSP